MYKYKLVAMGGTFDIIHKGHLALLRRAFEVGESVIIGVPSDGFVAQQGKSIRHNYEIRVQKLKQLLEEKFQGRDYRISKLEEDFGPAMYTEEVEAIVVSEETKDKCEKLNKGRKEKGLPPVDVVSVELVLAEDGRRISSTRIRNGEIDTEGNLLRK